MQGTACPYQREGGVYLDQQIGSQSTDQQIDYILPFIARDDPEKQAYKDGNREGESSLCHIYLEFVIACHGGLGLSIVRSILEKHNVPFGVDSKEGEGTSFWFELPLTEE